MQAAPCESLGTTTLLGGVECRWLPYPTGQPVKLRYHLTRTLRPCTTNIYLNLRRWTFQRYLRVMIHLFSLSLYPRIFALSIPEIFPTFLSIPFLLVILLL